MKAYSRPKATVPTPQVQAAKERRASFDKVGGRAFCPGFYRYLDANGRELGQRHADLATIGQAARLQGASCFFWFPGSLEQWLDGEPFVQCSLDYKG